MRLPRSCLTSRAPIALDSSVAATPGGFIEHGRLTRKAAVHRGRAGDHAGIERTSRAIVEEDGPNAPIDISPGDGPRSKRFTARVAADREAALRLE
jgi:hypothetical protein